jgi:hypothetical protein
MATFETVPDTKGWNDAPSAHRNLSELLTGAYLFLLRFAQR